MNVGSSPPKTVSEFQVADPAAIPTSEANSRDREPPIQSSQTDAYDSYRPDGASSVAASGPLQVTERSQHGLIAVNQPQTGSPPPISPSLDAEQSVLRDFSQNNVVHDDGAKDNDNNGTNEMQRSPLRSHASSDDGNENDKYGNLSDITELRTQQFTASECSGNSLVAEQIEAMQNDEESTEDTTQEVQSEAVDMAPDPEMLFELEPTDLSVGQYVAEITAINADLVAIELKCIEVVTLAMLRIKDARAEKRQMPQFTNNQWQALFALHTHLLAAYYDFFLVTFYPMATKDVRNVAKRYSMPSRMWQHGVYSYLELLRAHIGQPNVDEHAMAFINAAQKHYAIFKESVSGDKNAPESEQVAPDLDLKWIEHLGDLARYRILMSVEKIECDYKIHNDRDRYKQEMLAEKEEHSHWKRVAAHHYQEIVARTPTAGWLYHHLALLANDPFERLGLLSKSMSVAEPCLEVRDRYFSIEVDKQQGFKSPLSATVARLQGALLSGSVLDPNDMTSFFEELQNTIEKKSRRFRELGPHLATALLAGVVGFGDKDNEIMRSLVPLLNDDSSSRPASPLTISEQSGHDFLQSAFDLAFGALDHVVTCFNDPTYLSDTDLLPFLHVFIKYLQGTMHIAAGQAAASNLAWTNIDSMLNRLADQHQDIVNRVHPSAEAAAALDERVVAWLPEDMTKLDAASTSSQLDSAADKKLLRNRVTMLKQQMADQAAILEQKVANEEDIPETEMDLMLSRMLELNELNCLRDSSVEPAPPLDERVGSWLPEDITMLGAAWNSDPDSVAFSRARHQLASHEDIPEIEPSQAQDQARRERILRLAVQLAQAETCPWLGFDPQMLRFYIHDVKGKRVIRGG